MAVDGIRSAEGADMASLARDLLMAAVLHQKELKNVLGNYPWADSLVPSPEQLHELMSPYSPFESGIQTPLNNRSSVSSAGWPRELRSPSRSRGDTQASAMSDGSDSAVAVFEPIKAEEVQDDTFAAVLKVPELPQVEVSSTSSQDDSADTARRPRKSTTGKTFTKGRSSVDLGNESQDTTLLDSSLGVCVMLNALLIAFELECDGAHASVFVGLSDGMQCQDAMPLFFVTEHFFTAIFLLELCWRIGRDRFAYLWDWFNAFDTILVILSCIDLYVLQIVLGQNTHLRILRLFKLVRVVRLVRVTRMFRGLRLLVSACASFLPALGWAMALLSLCMLMGGVIMGSLLLEFIEDESQPLENRKWIWQHYGTAYRATYTMYEITMAGNWPQNVRPVLEYVSHAYVIFFLGYITVVVFAIIRVITAIFLSQTLEAASNDVDIMIQERMRKKSIFVERLEGIFQAIDESGDGLLSEEEMKELLQDSKVQAYLESLDVALPESEALFRLLQNSDGQITYEDFIEGILRCKGPARAMDQIVLQAELKQLGSSIQKLQDKMEDAKLIQCGKKRRNNKRHNTALASHLALMKGFDGSATRTRARSNF